MRDYSSDGWITIHSREDSAKGHAGRGSGTRYGQSGPALSSCMSDFMDDGPRGRKSGSAAHRDESVLVDSAKGVA